MKQSTLLVILVATLLKIQSTEAHFKPMHLESPLSSPLGFEQTSALSTFGQSSDLKTKLAIHKTITFLTILTSNPKLLCIVPPFLVIDFLTQLSCNPAILNAIPHHLLSGFMTSVTAVPTLANAIPPTLFVSISNSLSIGSPDSTGPAGSSGPELLPTPQPITSVSAEVAAVITPAAPSSGPASSLPGISVTKDVTASISPVAPSSGPAPGLPGVSITKDVTASITPSAPSPGPASSLPGVSITKDVSASIIPAAPSPGPASSLPGVSITQDVAASITPVAPSSGPASSLPGVSITKDVTASINPLPPADLPTSDGIPHAYPPAAPSAPAVPAVPAVGTSVPCIDVPTGGSPTLPALPLPSPTLPSLGLLSSLFNKGTAGSLIESKIEAIIKLFASGHLKLPQLPQLPPLPQLPLHIPEVGNTVSKKPIIHVNPEPSKVFILLPAPVLGKPEIPSAQATKLYYKPDSFNRILDFVHQRLFAPPQKLTLPKLNLPKLSLPKHNLPKLTPSYPAVSVQANPIKCPPIFSKVPC